EEGVGAKVLLGHLEELLGLRLIGYLVKPVPVREPQENLQQLADRALESPDGVRIADFEPVERVHHAIRKHEQRRLVDVRNQEEQEVLMAKLAQQAGIAIDEERIAGIADHREGVAGCDEAGPRRALLLGVPELVVAKDVLAI